MTTSIPIGKQLSIRSCGYDEAWLQDQIIEDPTCLRLGELEFVSRERQQASGGRLDILLKDPEDDAMYEVEVMLGGTDETHIIRTIEYWDNEKRKWPQRQHFAVLVAEQITRRFFNVIQLISHAVPMIAIQANIIEAERRRILQFTKVLDTYEEPEDDVDARGVAYTEDYWNQHASWTLEAAKATLLATTETLGGASLNFVKSHISITINGNNHMWLHKRSGGRSLLGCWLSERLLPQATLMLGNPGRTRRRGVERPSCARLPLIVPS